MNSDSANKYGAFCVEIIRTHDGKINLYQIDPSLIRSGKFNKDGKVTEYFYSKDWSRWRETEFNPISIPAFQQNSINERQLLFVTM